jgi:zinc D-Ala-D-Ala carboxypeptidase
MSAAIASRRGPSRIASPATPPIRIRRIRVAGLLVVIPGIAAALGHQSLASSSSTDAPPIDVHRGEHPAALGEADGAVPDGTTVFDDEIAGVAKLDPALLGALRQAATDAADNGGRVRRRERMASSEYQNNCSARRS